MPNTIIQVNNVVGFDTDTKLSLTLAKEFYSIGYRFTVRYLSLGSAADPNDLDKNEVDQIIGSGLMLAAIQHCPNKGWIPSPSLGSEYGNNAAKHAQTAGIIPGTTVFLDLEGVMQGTPPKNVIDYCTAWYNEVKSAGYVPGIYVGYGCVIGSYELYYDLPFTIYWKSMSNVPDVDVRGYCMFQSYYRYLVFGISIDIDNTKMDKLGGLPWFMIEESIATSTNSQNTQTPVLTSIKSKINSVISELQDIVKTIDNS